jgi:tetratricopeptide (TPR) repeat protein
MGIARAEAYAGRHGEAVRDGKAALAEMVAFDAYSSLHVRYEYGALLVIAGRPDEALSVLREVIALPMDDGFSPNEIRFDPAWSRLKADPRFDEILRSVKPL